VVLASLVLALAIATNVHPASLSAADPDWPCQQRLVPRLAAEAYWNGSPLEGLGDWRADPEVAGLVRHLAPRGVTTQEGLSQITLFAQKAPPDRVRRLALAFSGLLEETNRERSALIGQLKEVGRRQRELTDLVARLADELNSNPPDAQGETADKRADLQQRHDFTMRNFEEIQRTVRYACDAPVALDARLGSWARALQEAASE
jgi:hypothetical protein